MEWISVGKRVPEIGRWVIICSKNKNASNVTHYLYEAQYIVSLNNDKPYFSICSDDFNDDFEEITHWIYEDIFPWPND